MRILFGDQSHYLMPYLLSIIKDEHQELAMRLIAIRFFVRGGARQAILGPNLSPEENAYNRKIEKDNNYLNAILSESTSPTFDINATTSKLQQWFNQNTQFYQFAPDFWQKVRIFFLETRFSRYLSRVLTLDFGTLRDDNNKTVIREVTKRFKYSLTLSIIPMFLTFGFCLLFGFIMAFKQNRWPDYSLNIICLILYAIPVFVVAPFLIEKVALNHDFLFTSTPIPISGFTSPDNIYNNLTSNQRLFNVIEHIFLPLIAIMYGSLASQARLSRTAILEVLHQDYVRTAWAKGLPTSTILLKHVGRNAAITVVTSIAGSLGIVLGGSLIVETLFEINGFGKFFYDAVINRDYNVILFSTIAGSFLTLIGYLVADIAYTCLDPRLTLE